MVVIFFTKFNRFYLAVSIKLPRTFRHDINLPFMTLKNLKVTSHFYRFFLSLLPDIQYYRNITFKLPRTII